mgnify:CR=1 FL=1
MISQLHERPTIEKIVEWVDYETGMLGTPTVCNPLITLGTGASLRFEKKTEFLDKSSKTIDILLVFWNRSEAGTSERSLISH